MGQAVLVPFGRQGLINAFVVGFSDYVPEEIRVKKINRILDETPLFSLKYLKLLEWVANYYCTDFVTVLNTAIPMKLIEKNSKTEQSVELIGDNFEGLTKRQKEILELLKTEGKQPLIDFEEKAYPKLLEVEAEVVHQLDPKYIKDMYYDNLSDAITAAKENETIKLLSNAALEKGIVLTKNIKIDLNGNTITSPTAVFEVQKGLLTLTGKGFIRETEPNYGVIRVIGSETPTDEKYSIVKVGKDVTLEGWTGIFVSHKDKKSYGVNVYLEGTINAVSDIQKNKGIGIYVNGSIQDKNNEPTINILDGATINSNGFGLYIGGYANVFINGMFSTVSKLLFSNNIHLSFVSPTAS